MAYENLCMYCFEDNGGQDVCPHCGRDARAAVPQIQLTPGTLIYNKRFLVGRALGQDASGIVYGALDTKRSVKIRIREYLPRDSARRLNSGEVGPEPGNESQFEAGLIKLRASVEGVEDPTKRHFFFQENGTGYIAQRKASNDAGEKSGDSPRSGPRMALVVGVAAALVLAVAVGVILLVSYLTNRTDTHTDAPLPSSSDIWSPPASASPTPYASATFGTITDPQQSWMDFTNPDLSGDPGDYATPTPVPTAEDGFDVNHTINEKSSAETIKRLQKLLINLGWLKKGGNTGLYDSATRQAVKDFQEYMNDTYGIDPKLSVDGVAGPKTLAWLARTDVSVKPTATAVPVTPSPTQLGKVINEKSDEADIKYVQRQLYRLGMIKAKGINGKYDETTRAAVLKFQKRVNNLQGYDALDETGDCDANTLAYLDYYVEWWEDNRPTAAPTSKATAEASPAPTIASSGDMVDENSPSESIRFVQEMLKFLGYLEGDADGVYGAKTYAAVSEFQKFINTRHGNIVSVTGKCDLLTREYLEYYYSQNGGGDSTAAPTATPVSGVTSPSIAVTGARAYEGGVYIVGDAGVKIAWSAEGAASYNVYLTDDSGNVVAKEVSTQYTSLTIDRAKMSDSGIYTFTVVAIAKGGSEDTGARSYVRLSAANAIATATPVPTDQLAPVITVTGAQGYSGGVYQLTSQSGANIAWSSSGAGAYSLYLTDSASSVLFQKQNTTLTGYNVDTSVMQAGEKYTFTVVAIPQGGLEKDGAYSSVRLTLSDNSTPAPTTTPSANFEAPTIDVSGALGFRQDIYWVGEDDVTISWRAAGDVSAFSVYLKNSQGAVLSSLSNTDNTSMTVTPASMTMEEPYTITVVSIPVGGAETDGKSASVTIELYTGQTAEPTIEPIAEITAPAISVSGHVSESGGVYYAGKSALAISWKTQGEVAGYNIRVTSSDGSVILDREGSTKESMTIDSADMTAGDIYTFIVTAIPRGGTAANGVSSSVMLAVYVAPDIGAPVITVSGYAKYEGGAYYSQGDNLDISWTADNARLFSVYLYAADGTLIKSQKNVEITELSLAVGGLEAGEIYAFTVNALPLTGEEKDGKSASVNIALAKPAAPVVSAPEMTVTGYSDYLNGVYYLNGASVEISWRADNAVEFDVALYDQNGKELNRANATGNTDMSINTEQMPAGSVYTLTVVARGESGDEASSSVRLMRPEAEETPEPAPVGAPQILVLGYADFTGGVYFIGEDGADISWSADNAGAYNVGLFDSDGNEVKAEKGVTYTETVLDSRLMESGKVYTFTVLAIPQGGKAADGQRADIRLTLNEAMETHKPIVEATAPEITVSGYTDFANGVYYAGEAGLDITWRADGAVNYDVALYDENDNELKSATGVTQAAISLKFSQLSAMGRCRLVITAVSESGDGKSASVYVAVSAASAEAGAPVITCEGYADYSNETYYLGNDKLAVKWEAENATAYDVHVYDMDGGVVKSRENSDKTGINIDPAALEQGNVYTLTVTAYAVSGGEGKSASVMLALMGAEETEVPDTRQITPDSDPALITKLQEILYNLGWLTRDSGFTAGTLDSATVQAVYDYQSYIIAMDLNPEIALIDPLNPVVDEITLTMLADSQNPVTKPEGE